MSKFSHLTTYKLTNHDFILFTYADKKKALFPALKSIDLAIKPHKDQGGSILSHAGKFKTKSYIAVRTSRLDKKNSDTVREMKIAVSAAITEAEKLECKRVIIPLDSTNTDLALAAQEGALLGGYKFNKYLKEKKKPLEVILVSKKSAALTKTLNAGEKVFKWTNFARDILSEPANEIHPESLAKLFTNQGKKAGMKVTVWNEAKLKKENCGGILAVGKGASSRQRLVIGEYTPKRKAKKHLCLVGKGVTFDTGGYCLKPSASQIGMKMDMGGAAMMFSAACAIAELKLPIKVTVITPLVENDISSTAMHTEDIITMRNGLTVQVDNTDAEGRLVLADSLCIASDKKPDYIIDSATLTGACVVALGEDIAGLFGTDSLLNGMILDAADDCGEYMWEMPLHLPYQEQLKTTIAESSNMGSRWGGSITAALFLKKFVDEKISWSHIDIAGPGIKNDPLEHLGKGAKGFGVKTMTSLAGIISE